MIGVQTQVRQDYSQMSFVIITISLNATSEIPNNIKILTATGPEQAILCSSLASALLAAFLATLGKQWLKLHVDGSFIGRNQRRELKMSEMIVWRFKVVMECLPLIREASFLLLGCA